MNDDNLLNIPAGGYQTSKLLKKHNKKVRLWCALKQLRSSRVVKLNILEIKKLQIHQANRLMASAFMW